MLKEDLALAKAVAKPGSGPILIVRDRTGNRSGSWADITPDISFAVHLADDVLGIDGDADDDPGLAQCERRMLANAFTALP